MTSDYSGMDGIALLFQRPASDRQATTVTYHHSAQFDARTNQSSTAVFTSRI
jgi:hypothetical protein